jgi:hypothetical protein
MRRTPPPSDAEEWQAFFKPRWKDEPSDIVKAARGASWTKPNWPIAANGELVSALDGNWGVVEKVLEKKVQAKAEAVAVQTGTPVNQADVNQATRDSVRAIMMIRAYRMRGHLHANLDPLGIASAGEDYNELSPSNLRLHRGRSRPQDLHRQRAGPRIRDRPRDGRHPRAHLLLDDRRRVHAHLQPGGEGLDPGAHRRSGQGRRLHAGGQEGDPAEADRGRGLRAVHRRQVQGHQALRPRWR